METRIKKIGISLLSFLMVLCMGIVFAKINSVRAANENTTAANLTKVTINSKSIGMEMIDGAYVRTQEPTGIRFFTYVSLDDYNALVEEFGDVELGTELTANEKTESIVAQKASKIGEDVLRFATVISDIPEEMYNASITAKSYVKIGEDKAYAANPVTRSIKGVAEAALANPTELDNATRVLLEGFTGIEDKTSTAIAIDISFATSLKEELEKALDKEITYVFDATANDSTTSMEYTDLAVGSKALTVYTESGIVKVAINVTSSNVFDASNASGWVSVSTAQITSGYSNTEKAVYAQMCATADDIKARNWVIYTSIEPLRNAVKNGYTHMSFKVKAGEGFLDPVEGCSFGVRIFGKVKSGLDDVLIVDGNAGIYKIKDLREDDLTTNEYVDVVINIATVLNAHSDINYLGLCVSGKAGENGNKIFFKDATFLKNYVEPEDPTPVNEVNIFDADTTWSTSDSNYISVGYSSTEKAVYAYAGATVGAINARNCVIYTSIEPLRNAVKNGYTHMTFKVMASEGFLEAVAGCVFGVRIFGKVNSGLDGVQINDGNDGIYGIEDITVDDLTEGSYVTVTIDIATVLNADKNNTIKYLGLCVSGRAGKNIFFKDASFVKTNA